MVYNSLDKNIENREKMLLTFAKDSIRSKPPPSFRAVYHNKNHVITNTDRFTMHKSRNIIQLNIHRILQKVKQATCIMYPNSKPDIMILDQAVLQIFC